jgi:LmbE family N-acetylglucosaminyl deacetylase
VDYHPEHVRVAQLVADLVRPGQTVRVYELGVPLTPLLVNLVADIREVAMLKDRALAAFVTQVAALTPPERLGRYRAGFYGLPAVEVFWELPAEAYAQVLAARDWRRGACPFRGIRERPLSDPLSVFVGLRARAALRRAAELSSRS